MVSTPTNDEVQTVYDGTPVDQGDLGTTEASDLIDTAVSMFENVFSDKILFTSEALDEDEAVKYLAAHKWAIALGDEIQSESQAGGNVSYTVPTSTARGLSRTKYGQEVLEYLRDTPNIGVVRTR